MIQYVFDSADVAIYCFTDDMISLRGFETRGGFYFSSLFFTVCILDIFFSSNQKVHKTLCGLCFWALDPLIGVILLNVGMMSKGCRKSYVT